MNKTMMQGVFLGAALGIALTYYFATPRFEYYEAEGSALTNEMIRYEGWTFASQRPDPTDPRYTLVTVRRPLDH